MSAPTPAMAQHTPGLTEHDVYLFREGTHDRLYDTLGAHACEVGDVSGVKISVFAQK
jgi:1,4-alpha-glucan branching enzyme